MAEENKMGVMPEGRLVVTMSLPMMVSMLLQALYNIVDSVFVARISEDAVTAVSLAFPVQLLMIAIAAGTGVGINALLSRRLGQGRQRDADAVAANGVWIGVVLWAIFLVLGLVFGRMFIAAFTDDPNMITMGTSYVQICTTASGGVFLLFIAERLMQATGNTLYHMYTQLLGAGLNLILDPIMIFGLFGFPRLGVTGAALATVTGQLVSMVFGFYINVRFNHEVHLHVRGFRPDFQVIGEIYRIGLPAIVTQALTSLMTVGLNAILIGFSSTAVGFYGIYYKLQNFLYMPVFGMNNALTPMIGYNYGARKMERIQRITRVALGLALGIMFVGTLAFELFPAAFLSLFEASEEMLRIGIPGIRILVAPVCLAAVSVVLSGCLQGLGKGMDALVIALLRQLVLLLPLALLLAQTGRLELVWLSVPAAELAGCAASVFLWRYRLRHMLDTTAQKGEEIR